MTLIFSKQSFDEYNWWADHDKGGFKKIQKLLKEIARYGPLIGSGKPEVLKHDLSGWYSRRITAKDRLVYKIVEDEIHILQCRFHYHE